MKSAALRHLAVGAAGALGCAVTQPAPPAQSLAHVPDGVVLEGPASWPSPVARGEARGVVSLREAPAAGAVIELLQAFVDAWEHDSLDALSSLLTTDAGPLEGRARGRGALVESWRQRLRAHSYARFAGVELVRNERIQRWSESDLGAAGAPPRPPEMSPDEVFVRAPLEATRLAGERVFGDVFEMVLREQDGKLKIAAYREVDL
jgi:hypothetical protein